MKSIKEKAEEVSQLPTRITNVTDPIRKQYFELGANYVLDEIEKLVKFDRWSAQDLYGLIEQLKK